MMTTSSPPSDLPYALHRKPKDKAETPLRVEHPGTFSIRDPLQMVWELEGETLIAVPSSKKVKPATIFSVPCTDPDISNEKGSPIFLGVKEDLCLFCAEIEGRPTLQLKKESIMKLYEEKKAQKSFLFLRGIEGSTSTFQSVACLGWFIATSSQVGQPVTLTNDRGKTYNTNFYFSSL
ncbi:interleukin-36 beta-like isoform X3 [Myotis myotis]|nr:interleukin-36 beta-like isoform X3 [Myotis myotis]